MSLLWDGVREGCGSCRFWGEDRGDPNANRPCRRYPPALFAVKYDGMHGNPGYTSVEAHQPFMGKTDWCGEYVRNV